jgi:Concanavalin A-like lectin/glucanases superfamily/FG-GAP-like repeat
MRPVRALLAALIGVAIVPMLANTAHARQKPTCTPADTLGTALALARSCGDRVELLSQRTETGQTFLNPSGTTTYEEYAHPRRTRKTDGSWVKLDPTLVVNPDGTLSPRASTVDMVFSGGGTGSLISSRKAGKEIKLGWAGKLPNPVISGASATYQDVLSGVDLVVTATDTGFGEVFVVHDAAAAANPKLRKLAFDTSLSGLHWENSDGHLRALDASGEPVFAASAPMMWDSSDVDSGVNGPGQYAKTAPVGLTVANGRLNLLPDAGLLGDASARYPLYLDPTVGADSWTMINSQFTSQSYWSYDKTDCPPGYSGQCAKVGQVWQASMDYRSIFQFSSSQWSGRQVLDSRFTIDLLHSAWCAASTTELRPTGGINSGTTWSNHSGTWGGVTASVSNSDCSDARVATEFSSSSLTSALASAGATTTWGLKASTETSDAGWKKFDALSARLVVTANTVPAVATAVTVDAKACATGSGRPFVATKTPTLRGSVYDGDGNSLTAYFEWSRIRYDGSYGPAAGTVVSSLVPSGTTALATPAAGVLDKSFAFVATGDWDRDGYPDVLARDSAGDVYLLPGSPGGILKDPVLWGHGYGAYTWAGLADWDRDGYLDSIVRDDSNGNLWLYPGHGTRDDSGPRYLVGIGWNGYTFGGLADWDRDGFVDIITIDSGGVEWLYPGDGTHTGSTQARVQIGAGWGGYTPFGTIDWDRDGKPDMIARDPSSGQLWLYMGSGTRGYYTGTPYRYEIGSGWGGYLALTTPDVNGDGKADIVAQQPSVTDWFYYPGSGSNTYGGNRWTAASLGMSLGQYAFHVTVTDGPGWSGWGGWCEFEVDTVAPSQPSVNGDIYTANCGSCGSVGQTGRFTFSDAATDVVTYMWGFSSPPSNPVSASTSYVDWTPPSGGAKTLFVTAIDRAGNQSPVENYQFYVAPPSNAVVRWKLNESGGTALADDTGGGHTATLTGGTLGASGRIVGGDSALHFNGVGSGATAPSIVDTSKSFSVSAWVKLDDLNSNHSVVVANGTDHGAFYLWYTTGFNKWVFGTTTNDGPTYSWNSLTSDNPPQVGVWTHLVGVFDSGAHTMNLYVDGVRQSSTMTGVTAWNATNATMLGRTINGNNMVGSVAQVQLWNRLISGDEVTALAAPELVGQWDMSDVGPGPTYDASIYGHDLDFYPQPGGPQIPPAGSGHTGTGLHLDGVDDYAQTSGPVLNTDQSYTISAWVKLSDKTTDRAVMAQERLYQLSAFYLMYNAGLDRWTLQVPRSGTDATWWTVSSSGSPSLNTWTHLVGVYDAVSGQLKLYVNGTLQGTLANVRGWNTPDPLYIGRPGSGYNIDFFAGDVDDIRVYQGVVSDVTTLP